MKIVYLDLDADTPIEGVISVDRQAETDPPNEQPLPVITPAMLEVACATSYARGRREALADVSLRQVEVGEALLQGLNTAVRDIDEKLLVALNEMGDQLTQLIATVLSTMLPAFCKSNGCGEVGAVTRVIIDSLNIRPEITIWVHPSYSFDLQNTLNPLEPDHRSSIQIRSKETADPLDVELSWKDGVAIRDANALRKQIVALLSSFGAIERNPSLNPSTLAHSDTTATD